MPDPSYTRQFLRELAEWEAQVGPDDIVALDRLLAAIVRNPTLPGRIPSFYDPTDPSYLIRSGSVLIHYCATENGCVEFRNLFFRRT